MIQLINKVTVQGKEQVGGGETKHINEEGTLGNSHLWEETLQDVRNPTQTGNTD